MGGRRAEQDLHGGLKPASLARRGPISRALEREGALAFWLLVPTLVLLTLFIAYPFLRGIWLSLTSSVVGVPGEFVGLRNFEKIWPTRSSVPPR